MRLYLAFSLARSWRAARDVICARPANVAAHDGETQTLTGWMGLAVAPTARNPRGARP